MTAASMSWRVSLGLGDEQPWGGWCLSGWELCGSSMENVFLLVMPDPSLVGWMSSLGGWTLDTAQDLPTSARAPSALQDPEGLGITQVPCNNPVLCPDSLWCSLTWERDSVPFFQAFLKHKWRGGVSRSVPWLACVCCKFSIRCLCPGPGTDGLCLQVPAHPQGAASTPARSTSTPQLTLIPPKVSLAPPRGVCRVSLSVLSWAWQGQPALDRGVQWG